MTEINEALARFVWPNAKKIEVTDDLMCVDWSAKAGWIYKGLPFTGSLDAQAKYLWPKLYWCTVIVEPSHTGQAYFGQVIGKGTNRTTYVARGSTPALASAQAIAKLLEGKA